MYLSRVNYKHLSRENYRHEEKVLNSSKKFNIHSGLSVRDEPFDFCGERWRKMGKKVPPPTEKIFFSSIEEIKKMFSSRDLIDS